MSTAQDYVGRRVDVLVFQDSGHGALRLQDLFGFDEMGRVCAGVQKVAQRWLIQLLTPIGSKAYSEDGTNLIPDIRSGRIRTDSDAMLSFQLANLRAIRRVQASEEDGDPDDERLSSTELKGLAIAEDRIELRVQLTTRAGGSRELLVPLSVAP